MKNIMAVLVGFLALFASGTVQAQDGPVQDRPLTRDQAVMRHILDRAGCRHSNCKYLISGTQDEGTRRGIWHQKMADLEKKNPGKYRQVRGKIRRMRHAWLKQLKIQDPARYHQIMEQRRIQMQMRLEQLKQTDPQKYARIMAFKQRLLRLYEMKEKDPKGYRRFIRQNPHFREFSPPHEERRGMYVEE